MNKTVRQIILPVFIPQWGCPHRCVFCNQQTITAAEVSSPSLALVQKRLNEMFSTSVSGKTAQIAFFGGNFLGLNNQWLESVLKLASRYIQKGKAGSIRFSTRPDTITPETLAGIEHYAVSTIEIGAQSMNAHVLKKSGRGHTSEDTVASVKLLRDHGYQVGIQMMIGLPGDTHESCMESARTIAALSPDFVRIYPTLVISGSPLEKLYRKRQYRPLSLKTAVYLTARIYELFEKRHIKVIRMGLQPTAELDRSDGVVAGPYHPCFGHLVYSSMVWEKISSSLEKNMPGSGTVVIRVHPHRVSRIEGFKKENIKKIRRRFQPISIELIQDFDMRVDAIMVNGKLLVMSS
jgi:histone acetyltransferase (RNA polymerase elongator complex component)